MIDILVPVLGRPQNARPLVASAEATSSDYRILFLCSPEDDEQIAACRETGAYVLVCPFERAPGDYARKINLGFKEMASPWIFQASDDLRFHSGWDVKALSEAKDHVGVIGTNDLGNPNVYKHKLFATHSLIKRSYVDEYGASLEGPGQVLSETYDHNFVDRELVDLAKSRNAFVFCETSIVEHLHPFWNKGTMDAVYELGSAEFHRDQRLFWKRSRGWGGRLHALEARELKRAELAGIV